ncbi:MAG TPA: UDP-N-acetylmuramate--L-alanine ligase [Parvularculaceae bacterium]|nr:UDP-N-acetylmuramate--L-alanine ligase [Amphiplicatus sp.]HPE32882.1 UDP-N-acetylmuramate--L-alanine ligase [Parvularculaceae bacterium]
MSQSRKIKIKLPFGVGAIHFVGIGGIGMSGIAEVMHNLGYEVRGSDVSDGANVQRLREKGVDIVIGHKPENVEGADAVIVSSAVKRDNPEVLAARARHIPVVRRADMLAELMRLKWTISVAGTHGKTTTTTMIAALLDEGKLDPTVINGGVINAYGTNARLGEGDWMVVEADESDGTFIRLPTTVAVVTNIDPEHLDHWGGFESLRKSFDTFIENAPFYGFGVVCLDHPEVQALVGRVTDRRLITYGLNPQADVRAENISFEDGAAIYDIVFRERGANIDRIDGVRLPMPGVHNVLNSLAAAIVAKRIGVSNEAIKSGFGKFSGVKRRFTRAGEWNGVAIIDDYGHHPVEIAAVLRAARSVASGKVIAVVQPHRFTRLRDLFDDFCSCFNDADIVFVTDVYTAGEAPIEGVNRDALVAGALARGHRDVRPLSSFDALPREIAAIAERGDYVVCLGAGDITKHANNLADVLKKVKG